MTREHRIAIARIISDIIRADNIIEESEIRKLKESMARYGISRLYMTEARHIRFSDAVNALSRLPLKFRKEFYDCIAEIAVSDNVCATREALMLIALQYCLLADNKPQGKGKEPYLVSCAIGEASFEDLYMVYLESSYDERRNKELREQFRLLVTVARLYGFNFIYIPKLVEEFLRMDAQYVKDVIGYMSPSLNEDFIGKVYERLCEMTTAQFFKNVVYERLKVHTLRDTPPSLLINIGTSVVPYCSSEGPVQYYTEFLCVPIGEHIMTLIDDFLGRFQNLASVRQTITVANSQGQFKYFGFYKALFDFLIAPPPVEPELIFAGLDMKRNRNHVVFRFADGSEKSVDLAPKEYDNYLAAAKGQLTAAKADRFAISRLNSKIQKMLPGLTYIDQYKLVRPEKTNRYELGLDPSKIKERITDYAKDTITELPLLQ